MKTILLIITISQLVPTLGLAQDYFKPNLSSIDTLTDWTLHNRTFTIHKNEVHFNGQHGDGLLWLNGMEFQNGIIEVDIKGKDIPGKSFVGIAFHGLNDSVFDAVYFRAFNFQNQARKNHSVQYIAHPENTWYSLRETFPNKYENEINPVPDPNNWFHVSIHVNHPAVVVYVNNSKTPSLSIKQISRQKQGSVGFWLGNYSEGSFRNLRIDNQLQ